MATRFFLTLAALGMIFLFGLWTYALRLPGAIYNWDPLIRVSRRFSDGCPLQQCASSNDFSPRLSSMVRRQRNHKLKRCGFSRDYFWFLLILVSLYGRCSGGRGQAMYCCANSLSTAGYVSEIRAQSQKTWKITGELRVALIRFLNRSRATQAMEMIRPYRLQKRHHAMPAPSKPLVLGIDLSISASPFGKVLRYRRVWKCST